MKNINAGRIVSALVLGAGALVYGCGSSGRSPGTGNGADATTTDVATFEQLSASLQSTASGYEAAMLGPNASAASCASVHDQYDAAVRPMVAHMLELSGSMDGYMSHHGGSTSADYACMSATMMDELDYHRSRACASADLSANQLEVTRHVGVMSQYAGYSSDRCQEVMGSLEGKDTDFGARAGACQTWDGQCTDMMHSECCVQAGGHTGTGGHMGDGSEMMGGTSMMGSCVDW